MAVNAFEVFAKIGADTTDFDNALSGMTGALKSFAGWVADKMKQAGQYMYGFAKDAVNTGMNFDQAMAGVAATLGKSVDEVQELRDFAKQMGESTRYSALQAAEGLNYMALAGYDAEKSMKMLPEVMNLASAGGMELGRASDVITDAQSALGLSIEQTSTLINQMAKTASSSNTSVSQLGEAILQIGGTAKDMKGGTLELATTLGLLANNGIKGAEGGTALRNIMNSLVKSEGKAAEALASMNVSLFDAKGNMRDLNSVFKDMDKAMSKMTTQERKQMITTIFNARDLKSVEALLANAGEAWDELQDKIKTADEENAAAIMAGTQESTLAGAKKLFESAVEGLKINLSEIFTPALTEFTNFKTKIVSGISATIGESASKISKAFKEKGFGGMLEVFTSEFRKIKEKAFDYGIDILTNITQSISGNAKKIGEGTISFISTFAAKLTDSDLLKYFGDAALNLIDGLAAGLSSQKAIDGFLTAAPKFLTGLTNGITTLLGGENGNSGLLGAVVSIIENTAKWMEDDKNKEKFKNAAGKFLSAFCKQAQVILDNGLIILANLARLFLDTFLDDIDYDHGAEKFWISFGTALKKAAGGLWDAFLGGIGFDSPEQAMNEAYEHAGGSKQYQDFKREWEETAERLGGYEEAYDHYMNMPYQSENAYKSQEQKAYDQKWLAEAREAMNRAYEQIADIPLYVGWVSDYMSKHTLQSAEDYAYATEYIQKIINSRNSGKSDYYKSQGYVEKTGVKGVPVFGDGAIVSKPTLAMIGERGEPEAVVPLGHETETSRALGLGGGITVQFGDIYVQGGENSGRDFINQVNEQLRNLEIRQLRGIGGTAWQH